MQIPAYVGLRARGLPGAAATYVGFGLAAFSFMVALSAIYMRTYSLTWDIPRIFVGVTAFVALHLKVNITWIVLLGIMISMLLL